MYLFTEIFGFISIVYLIIAIAAYYHKKDHTSPYFRNSELFFSKLSLGVSVFLVVAFTGFGFLADT